MNTQQLPQLSIGEALKAACNKIFQFNGRSRRSEFWWTALVVLIINAITQDTISWLMYLLMIPITFRRLHDTGRSGWWWGAGIIATYIIAKTKCAKSENETSKTSLFSLLNSQQFFPMFRRLERIRKLNTK